MKVGVRELKAKLSEYLAAAASGTRVVVTDRGRPIAEIVPLGPASSLEAGIEHGWVEPARRASFGDPLLLRADATVADVLDDDRGR